MVVFGYKFDNKTLIANGLIAGASIIVISSVAYAVAKNSCDYTTNSKNMSESDAANLSCEYLEGKFSNLCPEGFPSFFDLCIDGFRSGFELAKNGAQSFMPDVFNKTDDTCNEYFGNNSTLSDCYQDLTDQCWSGAWVGFSWEKSAASIQTDVTTTCNKAASKSAWAVAGLTLFAGLVSTGVNAVLNSQKEKNAVLDSSTSLISR